MSEFYDEMVALAVDMLNTFGGPATLTRPAASTFDKKLGKQVITGEPSSQSVLTVVGPVEMIDDDGRKVFKTIATLLVEPREGDALTQMLRTFRIGKVTVIAPIGAPIVYLAEVA